MVINLGLVAIMALVGVRVFRGGLLRGLGMFLSVLVAASLATAWYEWLAAWLEKQLPAYTYFLDVAAVWLLFGLILAAIGGATTWLVRGDIRFAKPVEIGGSVVIALMTAWTVVEFTALSLHTAPLKADAVPTKPGTSMLFGLKPDRCWLWWIRGSSRNGPFANPAGVFDPENDFVERHELRRTQLAQEPSIILPGK